MVVCSCGKEISKVPSWLSGVKVEFICTDCPNRTLKSIADVKLDTTEVAVPSTIGDEAPELDEEELDGEDDH